MGAELGGGGGGDSAAALLMPRMEQEEASAAAAPPRRKFNLAPLEGVRGVGALLIVCGHLLTFWTSYTPPGEEATAPAHPLLAAVGLDYLSAVTTFVALSGFTLHAVSGGCGGSGDSWGALASFVRRRATRLAPMYGLGCLLGVVPCLVYGGWPALLLSGALTGSGLQALTVIGNDLDGPLWTVSALLLCYAAFPRLQRGVVAAPTPTLWRAFAACALASAALAACWLSLLGAELRIILHIFGPFRLPQFAMGVVAAELGSRGALARSATALAWAGAAVMAGNLLASLAYVAATRPNFEGGQAWAYGSEFILAPALHSLWMAAIADPSCGAAALTAALSSRPLRWLGSVSYAVYCLHFPLFQWLAFAAKGGVSATAVPLVWGWAWACFPTWALPLLIAAALLAGAAAHYGIEAPLHRRWRQPAPKAAAEAQRLAAPIAAA